MFEDILHDDARALLLRDGVVDALAGQGVIGAFASPRDPGTASSRGTTRAAGSRASPAPGPTCAAGWAACRSPRRRGARGRRGGRHRRAGGAIRPGEGVELEDGTRSRPRGGLQRRRPARARAARRRAPADFRGARRGRADESPVLKVNFALSRAPEFPAGRARHARHGQLHRRRRRDGRARAGSAGGRASPRSCGASCTSRPSPTRASRPDGRHVMSAFCQYVPTRWPRALGRAARRDRRPRRALDRALRAGLPRPRGRARGARPARHRAQIGLTGGHIFQGECLPEHMWDRRLRLPHRCRGRVPVRRRHPPGRQRDRRQRPQRGAGGHGRPGDGRLSPAEFPATLREAGDPRSIGANPGLMPG